MSDRVAKSYSGYDGKAGQSIHPYQSAWTAHWTGTRRDMSLHNHSSHPCGNKGDDRENYKPHQILSGVESASEIPRSAKGFRELEHSNAKNIDKDLAESSKNLANESLGCQLYPTAKLCQESGRNFSLKNERDMSGIQEFRSQVSSGKLPTTLNIFPAPPAAETSTCQFQPDGILQFPADQVKYHMFFGESNYCSRPLKEKSIVPTRLDNDEFRFDSTRTATPSFTSRPEELKQVTSILASKQQVSKSGLPVLGQEHCNYQSHSALLVREEKMSNFLKCGNSATPYARQNTAAPLEIGPSTSTYNPPACDDGQYHRMQSHYGSRFFPCLSSPSEMTKSRKLQSGHPSLNSPSETTEEGKLQYGQCSLQSIPHFVHDVLDSAEGFAGGRSRFSRTKHSFLITEHTDFSLCKQNQVLGLGESRGSTQLNQYPFSSHRTFPLFNHGKQGVKIHLLGSSTESEEKEDAGAVKTSSTVQRNESSAETNIMDMEPFKENDHLSGANSSPPSKGMTRDQNLAPQIACTTAAGSRKRTIELPDINLELPSAPASSGSIEEPEPSTSRTQSLDMELLLDDADKPGNSKSVNCEDAPLEPELPSSWVKRLKVTVPNSASPGTKNSNMEESSAHEKVKTNHEKVNAFFSQIIKCTTTDPEPTTSHRPGKEVMAIHQTKNLLRTGESSSTDKGMKDQSITLSHSWIQRWCYSQGKKTSKTMAASDPQSPKLGSEDLEKKQFPSIAAMALMGRVMNGVEPCEFQKKGSFIVWNTKGS